jgi:hypothetical protein
MSFPAPVHGGATKLVVGYDLLPQITVTLTSPGAAAEVVPTTPWVFGGVRTNKASAWFIPCPEWQAPLHPGRYRFAWDALLTLSVSVYDDGWRKIEPTDFVGVECDEARPFEGDADRG